MFRTASVAFILFHLCFTSSYQIQNELYHQMRFALERTLDYIYINKDKFNLDGIFGVVFVKAQLDNTSNQLLFESINEKANRILTETKILEKGHNTNYKIFAKYLLDPELWKRKAILREGRLKFTDNLISCQAFENYMKSSKYFNESSSDFCIAELIKSSLSVTKQCKMNEFCFKFMVQNDQEISGYETTHRLLFLQISRIRGCNWNENWLKRKIREYCSSIYWEVYNNEICQFIPSLNDLFLEQVLLCGYEGFAEFFAPVGMKHILNIQQKSGCFSPYFDNNQIDSTRKKREYNVLNDGCIDHTTGLGAGVLSLFLQFMSNSDPLLM